MQYIWMNSFLSTLLVFYLNTRKHIVLNESLSILYGLYIFGKTTRLSTEGVWKNVEPVLKTRIWIRIKNADFNIQSPDFRTLATPNSSHRCGWRRTVDTFANDRILTNFNLPPSCVFQFYRAARSAERARVGRGVHGELDKRVQNDTANQNRLGNVEKQYGAVHRDG